MRQYSAALLSLALGSLKALFLAPRGRHARRRHRSTRVRRYAPLPQARTHALASSTSAPVPALVRVPAPRLAPAPDRLSADDLALVRPYYTAHERELDRERAHELDRIQAEATARMCGWAHRDVPPSGDLLAPAWVPDPTRGASPPPAVPSPPAVAPAPRAPHPACEDADDWRTFTRLTRVWLDQQEHRRRQAQFQARPQVQGQMRGQTREQRAGVAA